MTTKKGCPICGTPTFAKLWPSLVNSYEIGEYSSDPGGLIRWPVRLLIPVGFTMLALQGVSEVIKRVAFLRGLAPDPAVQRHQEIA